MKYRPTKSRKWVDQRRNRRIVQEYGLQEAQRSGFLDTDKNSKKKKKHKKHKPNKNKKDKWKRFEQVAPKTGLHIGLEYEKKYQDFISNGGDLNSCPFD